MKRRYHAPKNFKLRTTDPPEVEFHKTVADLLDWVLLPPTLWTTFPAGWGLLPIQTASRLKRCGLKPGFPDILIWRSDGRSMGLELKRVGKKVSPAQTLMHAQLASIGVPVFVVETVEEVIAILRWFELPLRKMHLQGGGDAPQSDNSEEAGRAA